MSNPVSAASYLGRAQALRKLKDKASLIYAALELRCGIEARLQEHASLAPGISKAQADEWEIKKLSRTIDAAFGLGDSMLLVFVTMGDGRSCQFMYAPVSSRLQEIGKRCGDYLHALDPGRVVTGVFWTELGAMLKEGCGLLELACSSEILRPTLDKGLHFSMPPDDLRVGIVQDLVAGKPGKYSTVKLTPIGPLTYYEPEEGNEV
jgi:hypothetical protein